MTRTLKSEASELSNEREKMFLFFVLIGITSCEIKDDARAFVPVLNDESEVTFSFNHTDKGPNEFRSILTDSQRSGFFRLIEDLRENGTEAEGILLDDYGKFKVEGHVFHWHSRNTFWIETTGTKQVEIQSSVLREVSDLIGTARNHDELLRPLEEFGMID